MGKKSRKLRDWNITIKVEIVPTEEAEDPLEAMSDRAQEETSVTVTVSAYTRNAALDRFARNLSG